MARLISLPRPSDETVVRWRTRCDCRRPDELEFAVGIYGAGMPVGVPFIAPSSWPCSYCDAYKQMWFQWERSLIWVP